MAFTLDARIPVIFATSDQAGAEDAILAEGGAGEATARFQPTLPSTHPPGCACCAPRNAAGRALGGLLQARARGEIPFFRRVVACMATEDGRRELEVALASDPVASSCYRLI